MLLFTLISKKIVSIALLIVMFSSSCYAHNELEKLRKAYPNFIRSVSDDSITWKDGSRTNITDKEYSGTKYSPSLIDQLNQPEYQSNYKIRCENYVPKDDPGRVRNEEFFKKMYGKNEYDVKRNLVTIYWMPKYFGHKFPLLVTRINGVDSKLNNISTQLESLVKIHPEYLKYLNKPAGTFYWRRVKNSDRLSPHSYGIAIDINSTHSNYWIWDTGIKENKLGQKDTFVYKNRIPCEIVTIFENNGFIWGGKWLHYDTMHFEYRPEFFVN